MIKDPPAGGSAEFERLPEEDQAELFERLEHRLESLGLLTDSSRRLRGPAEEAMMRTLSSRDRPLLDITGFEHAHRGLARGLEAITKNGKQPPALSPRLGPLRVLMNPLVQFVTGWIVEGQTRRVVQDVRQLYELREANASWNSPEHIQLRRSRRQMQTISEDVGRRQFGLPVFLLSGAFVSGLIGAVRAVVVPALGSRLLVIVLTVAIIALFSLVAATVLQAASIARMRLLLALAAPLTTLYQAIGSTGEPPRDHCFLVAVIALVLFAVAAIAVPGGIFLLLQI